MEITHHTRSIHLAPRKLRLVIDQLRHKKAEEALALLPLVNKRGAVHVQKSLKAAVYAAADVNLAPESLVIQRISCDEGPAMKRMIKRSHGRSTMIMKKQSHLSIVLVGEQRTRSRRRAKTTEATAAEEPTTEQESHGSQS